MQEAILETLVRTAIDSRFVVQMTFGGSDALKGYQLDEAELSTPVNGDVKWLEARIGSLAGRIVGWTRGYLDPWTD